jgi:hypothetical protein
MEVSGHLYTLATLLLSKEPPITIGTEAGWTPEPEWTLWRKEQSLAPAGNRTSTVQLESHHYTNVL